LYVVDQEHLHFAEAVPKIIHLVEPKGIDKLVGKFFRSNIKDAAAVGVLASKEKIADSIKEMGFSETYAAVYEKRIIYPSGIICHSKTCGIRKLVARADHEVFKRIFRFKKVRRPLLLEDDVPFLDQGFFFFQQIFDSRLFMGRFLENGSEQGLEIFNDPIPEKGIGNNNRAETPFVIKKFDRVDPGFKRVFTHHLRKTKLDLGTDVVHEIRLL
jgi:hypothetical protein